MKKILLTIFALLSLNLAVFAYSETDLMNDLDKYEKLNTTAATYWMKKDYTNAYSDYTAMREAATAMYKYIPSSSYMKKDELLVKAKQMIALTYYAQGLIDIEGYNNLNKALLNFSEALKYDITTAASLLGKSLEYLKAGDYQTAESLITVIINAPGLDNKKLSDSYKIRAQIREKLNNTTGAQEDYKKYNELMSR